MTTNGTKTYAKEFSISSASKTRVSDRLLEGMKAGRESPLLSLKTRLKIRISELDDRLGFERRPLEVLAYVFGRMIVRPPPLLDYEPSTPTSHEYVLRVPAETGETGDIRDRFPVQKRCWVSP